jgi:anhydro-N-acetylmuramic acid kinase
MPLLRAIGLMSGTSMDGVDVALIETDGEAHVALGPTFFLAYGDEDRALLRAAIADAVSLSERNSRAGALAAAEAMITNRHAEAVEAFLVAEDIDAESIDIVGFHGQTVLHRPEKNLTIQIGDGAALAKRLGIPVIHDLRAADVAAGGQGAPLVPVYHRALVVAAGLEDTPVALVNIGGVANVTFVAPGGDPVACDCGPGNALIDDLMLSRTGAAMDRGGASALAGDVDEAALAALLDHPFFDAPPPKSLDRNAFSRAPVEHLSTLDAAATLVEFTAEGIARCLRQMPEATKLAIVCGGGARNPAILRALARRTNARVETADAVGWSADAMEAQAFGYLAVRSLRGLPITFRTTTGVARAMCGGVLELP